MSERSILTDTDRLNWLIESGHLSQLRLFRDGIWAFEDWQGGSPREAIDVAMSYDEYEPGAASEIRVWRCDDCGLTCPADTKRDADERHWHASTNCPGPGRMVRLGPRRRPRPE